MSGDRGGRRSVRGSTADAAGPAPELLRERSADGSFLSGGARSALGWIVAAGLPIAVTASVRGVFANERFGVAAVLLLVVMVVGYLQGTRAALFSALISTLALVWFLISPTSALTVEMGQDRAALALFLLASVAAALSAGAAAQGTERADLMVIDQQRTSDLLRFQSALLKTQSEAGIEGQLIVSPTGEILSCNARFVAMWDFPVDLVERGSDDEALAAAMRQIVDPEGFIAKVRECYANPVGTVRDEVTLVDGRVFDRWGSPLRSDDTTYLGWAWYFRDVTDHKRAEDLLRDAGERSAALARTLQQSLLPPQLPEVPGLELAARYHPAGTGLEVGGDFYDVFAIGDDRWAFGIGDVCGKGAAAATIAAAARHTVRAASTHSTSPAAVLRQLNEVMLMQGGGRNGEAAPFCTIVHAIGQASTGGFRLQLAVGGHPPPFLRRTNGMVDQVGKPGTLVGVLPTVDIADVELHLAPGDSLVLVTDGVLEAHDGERAFDEIGLAALLADCDPYESAATLALRIEQAALEVQGGVPRDDIAILVVRATEDR